MEFRDEAALRAMAAIIAKLPLMGYQSKADDVSIEMDSKGRDSVFREVAKGAYGYADALVAERAK